MKKDRKIITKNPDIAERKKADLLNEIERLELRVAALESEKDATGTEGAARWRVLVDEAPVSIATVGLDKRFLTCNAAFCSFLGYSEQELKQKTIAEVTYPEDVAIGMADLGAIVAGKMKSSRVGKRYVRKDGTVVWGEVIINLVRNEQGQPLYFMPYILDMTERQHAAELLRENELKYRALFETAEGAILLFADGRWVDCNAKAERIFGCTREQIIGAHPSRFSPPTQPDGRSSEEEAVKLITLAYTTGPQSFEWEHCRVDGATFAAEVNLNRVDLGGKPHIQAIVRDVSQRKQAEKLMSLQSDVLKVLISNISAQQTVEKVVEIIKQNTGLDAVGVRLRIDNDYPFVASIGYSEDFLKAENTLLNRYPDGGLCRNADGTISLECTCGMVITGKSDPDNPLLTPGGSVWTNNSLPFLDAPPESDPRLHPRNRCIHVGLLSVALIPIRSGTEILGLLHLADRHQNSFSPAIIPFYEGIGISIGVALSRKQVKETLQAETANLYAIFESSPVAMFVVDETTNIVMTNQAFTVMCGGSEADILQHRPGNALRCVHSHKDPRGCGYAAECKFCNVRKGVEGLIANGGTIHGAELVLELIRNGTPQKVWMSVGAESMQLNGRLHVCIAMDDITERKRAEGKIALNSQRMQTLLKLNQMTEATLKEITDFVLEEAVRLTQSKLGYLAFLNEDESVLTMHSWSKSAMAECAINEKPIIYPVASTGLWGEAVRQRRPVITNDYTAANPLKKGYPQGHVAVKSHMNVPVFVGSRIVIVAGVGNKAEEYVQEDVEQLTLLMEGMWRLLERKRAEDSLQRSLREYQEAGAMAHVGHWRFDPVTQGFWGSPEALRIYNFPPGESVPFADIVACISPVEVDRVVKGLFALVETGKQFDQQFEIYPRGDSEPRVLWSIADIEEGSEKGSRVVTGILQDITERKRAEEMLRIKNIVFDASIAANSIADMNGTITEANDAFLRVWGYPSKDEVIGKPLPQFINDQKEAIAIVTALNNTGQWEGDYTAKRKDGSTFVAYGLATTVTDEKGTVIGYQSAVMDVTGQREAEKDLKRYRDHLEQLVDERTAELMQNKHLLDETGRLARIGGWEIDLVKNELTWTDTVYQIHEIGRDFKPTVDSGINFYVPEAIPIISECVKQAVENGKPFDVELQLMTAKKNRLWVRAIGQAYKEGGKVVKVGGVFQDIEERKKAEMAIQGLNESLRRNNAELQASNKEIEAFAYSVSHDLRAPLRTIDGFSLALLEDCEEKLEEQGKDYLLRVRAATQHMAQLIDDMLKLSRITRAELNIEKIDLTKMAWSVISELQKSQPERHVEIRIADGIEGAADSRLMRLALENLLGNAWKFTGKQTEAVIEFGATKEGNNKVYFIRDNGAGFDMAYVNKLFTPFQRLHTMEEYPGTGIGLATVQRIIHRHGGKAWTEGQVGKGATFYFSLQG